MDRIWRRREVGGMVAHVPLDSIAFLGTSQPSHSLLSHTSPLRSSPIHCSGWSVDTASLHLSCVCQIGLLIPQGTLFSLYSLIHPIREVIRLKILSRIQKGSQDQSVSSSTRPGYAIHCSSTDHHRNIQQPGNSHSLPFMRPAVKVSYKMQSTSEGDLAKNRLLSIPVSFEAFHEVCLYSSDQGSRNFA